MTRQPNIVFSFGKNWESFLASLTEEKIQYAEESLKSMLKIDNITSKRFLDAGCGSGLFSLAALRLGAKEVVSFDIDQDSIRCAESLNERFGPFPNWHIKKGSALDRTFLDAQGKFDVVYSWGVLHHTGNMWAALANITSPVSLGGTLFISIYNDQGVVSKLWRVVKRLYNIAPWPVKTLMAFCYYLIVLVVKTIRGITKLQSPNTWFEYSSVRGMNIWHDAVDWIGGYPFETASVDEICTFYDRKRFALIYNTAKTGCGCNEFIFKKNFENNLPCSCKITIKNRY